MQQKYDVKFIKTALDKDREKFLFSAPCKYSIRDSAKYTCIFAIYSLKIHVFSYTYNKKENRLPIIKVTGFK